MKNAWLRLFAEILVLLPGCGLAADQSPSPPQGDPVTRGIHGFFDKVREAAHVPNRESTAESSGPSVSPLHNLLPPYDPSLPFDKQFPRIAVTVLKTPANHTVMAIGGARTCYKLRARIWQSPDAHTDTSEFGWCWPEDLPKPGYIQSLRYMEWSISARVGTDTSNSTGVRRTEGPLPPDTPFPEDNRDLQFLGPMFNTLKSFDGAMVASLAQEAGIEPSTADRRFWIVNFSEAGN